MRHQDATCINDRWRFYQGELSPTEMEQATDLPWCAVTLPHSWNALDTMEVEEASHYARTVGWYVRELASRPPGRRLWVEIEAASQRASVWCNGRCIGEHAGGYTAFTVELPAQELDDAPAAPRMLAVRVDNLPDPDLIPSDLADFFLYGGLTRNVWLYSSGPCRLATLRCETEVTAEAAVLTLRGQLDVIPPHELSLDVELFSPQGERVLSLACAVTGATFLLSACQIQQPDLWSPDHPVLYILHARLCHGEDIWDAVEERIGLRFFTFPEGGPFLLNGQVLRLYGTHRHEDWAGRGSAVPDQWTRQEMVQIKQAGFNFVRLAHYPQAPAVLAACDELGLLVWEELPWCRGGIGGDLFRARTLKMLAEMIEQHYNHPAIIMWGLGNELDWESEHPASTDEQICAFLRTLHKFAHEHDARRLTALRRFEPGACIVDVYSPSIWSGWYRGRYEDYETVLDDALARYPRMLHMEWGGDSHYGRHRIGEHIATELAHEHDHAERPGSATSSSGPPRASRDGDWSESYMLDLMEWHLRIQLRHPRLVGNAQWAFKDFGTPLRPENPIPYVNQKGIVDRAGRPKDLYYLFQSYLTSEPMCFIESPDWTVRTGRKDELQRVRVYSNCARVSLFVNGRFCGERRRDPALFPAAGLIWDVHFFVGHNELRAVGVLSDGQRIEHTIVQEYNETRSGTGAAFRWQVEQMGNVEGSERVRITLQLIDRDGQRVVDDRRRISCSLQGEGQLEDRMGIVGASHVIELVNGCASLVIQKKAEQQATLCISSPALADTAIVLI